MKIIFIQPAVTRFKWELQVTINQLIKLNYRAEDVVLLFARSDDNIPNFFENLNCEVHVYPDDRLDKSYIPSIRPFLWAKYLQEDPKRELETYLYLDSDAVLLQQLNLSKLKAKPDLWFGSDCNGYLNLKYIQSRKNGSEIARKMVEICKVQLDQIEQINSDSIGAQIVLCQPTIKYWQKVYHDSNELYRYFKITDTDLQKWTAEMWAMLWNMVYFDIQPKTSSELDFCWATDDVSLWYQKKIYHNAGVTSDMKSLFFKGSYFTKEPFDDDFSFVDKTKCSRKYVELIKSVR